jgi:hypothetical protein
VKVRNFKGFTEVKRIKKVKRIIKVKMRTNSTIHCNNSQPRSNSWSKFKVRQFKDENARKTNK